jgi:uncharacterized membrane protein
MRTITLSAAILTLTLAPAAAHAEGDYQLTPIDHPDATTLTFALGLNDRGDVAGTYDAPDGTLHGYVLLDGVFQDLEFPGATQTVCAGIEENRRVTGTYFDAQGFQHGFQWHDGEFTAIDVPGAAQIADVYFEFGTGLGTSAARSANQLTIGDYADSNGFAHGFVLDHGVFQTIDFPGALQVPGRGTAVIALNDQGTLGGSYLAPTWPPVHGFLLAEGQFTTFDVPGAGGFFGTQVNGINNHGAVVGPYSDTNNVFHGYVFDEGQLFVVDGPGAFFTEVDSINDHGDITGAWLGPDGIIHAYLGTR